MLRIAEDADVPAILAVYAPYVLHSTATFEYEVPAQAEFLQRFRSVTARFPWLVWEEDGQILGYAYAALPFSRAAYAWCAEPTVYLKPEAQGRGIGKRLYGVLEVILQMQGYRVLYAKICDENTASVAFHENRGYAVAARFPDCAWKFGRWVGLTWMEKRLPAVESPSDFPVSWLSIRQDTQRFSNILDNLSLS